MPIFRTALSSNYAQISNAFADTPMKFQAKALLLHLLVKPPEWRVNKAAIAKTLDLSIYIVKKSLAWLRKHGYAIYQHAKDGFGQWFIYDTPQLKPATPPVKCPKSAIPTLALEPTLVIHKETVIHKEQQTSATAPAPTQNIVVVSSESIDGLIYPAQIKDLKPIKAVLRKIKPEVIAKQPAIKQEVLFELAYRMTLQNLRSVPAFLNTLVTAVNDGTFTLTATKQDTGSTIGIKAHIETQHLLNKQRQGDAKVKAIPDVGLALFAAMKGFKRTT